MTKTGKVELSNYQILKIVSWYNNNFKPTGTCYIESYLFNPQRPSIPKGCTIITPNT